MKKRGFTLIELIVVIAIIAVLAAIIAPTAFRAIEKARISSTLEDVATIRTGAMSYFADVGSWPLNCTASPCTTDFVNNTGVRANWDGPYVEKWPATNRWGGNYTWGIIYSGWGTSGLEARYVQINNVPNATIDKIDTQVDGSINGADNSTGNVHFNKTAGTVQILVSKDPG